MATILFLFAGGLGACSDPCTTLCETLALELDTCQTEWGLTWEAFGADSRVDWRTRCENDWDGVRADLEAREVPAAEDQCQDAAADLNALSPEGDRCDVLRALYVE